MYAEATAYALLWSVASTLIILLNKRVMASPSSGGLGFAYPMTLTFLGTAFSAGAAAAVLGASSLKKRAGERKATANGIGWRKYLLGVVPCSCCAAVTLVFGNAAYETLNVSFIQMLKAATPLFTMAVSFLILGKDPLTGASITRCRAAADPLHSLWASFESVGYMYTESDAYRLTSTACGTISHHQSSARHRSSR